MDHSPVVLKAVYFAFLVIVALASPAGIFAEDRAVGELGNIPRQQLEAYVEVTRVIVINPSMDVMDIKALLAQNSLTIEDYDRIDQQVKEVASLQRWVDERLTAAVSGRDGMHGTSAEKSRLNQDGEKPSPN